MFRLIRGVIGFAVLSALGYAVFFVPLGGQTLASHLHDIWRAPVVQEKVGSLTNEMRGRVESEFKKVSERAGVALDAQWNEAGQLEISDADRKQLEALLKAESD